MGLQNRVSHFGINENVDTQKRHVMNTAIDKACGAARLPNRIFVYPYLCHKCFQV